MIPGLKSRVFSLHDVLMYLAIARKHLRLMALLMCFSLMCGLTYFVFARPVYHAKAYVLVQDLSLPLDTDKIYNDSGLQSVALQFTAPHILERTAHALGVDGSNRELQEKYLTKITAQFDMRRNLIVDVWVATPELANNWTKAMVDQFMAYRNTVRVEKRDNMAKTFAAELQEALTRLDRQTAEKINFKDARGLTEATIRLRAINSLPDDLVRLNMRIDEMGRVAVRLRDPDLADNPVAKLSLIASVEDKGDNLRVGEDVRTNSEGAGEKKVVVIPQMVDSRHEWDSLLQDQARLKAQVDEKSKIFLPANPKMRALLDELQSVEEKLESAYQVAQTRFDLKYQQLINERNDLSGKTAEYNKIKSDYETLLAQVALFDTSRLPYETIIAEMKKKLEISDFAGEKERVNLHYSELINVSEKPESPNRGKLVMVSLVIGLALSIGVPFLIEYLDHTLSNLEQVESTFRMRGLGIVPQIDASSVGAAALISHDESRKDALIENFRVIRTNVISMGALTKEPHVIMVTSAMPKEGKTVVSSNLAVSFAHTGARTLLVDTDLRRGRLHRLFGYRKDPGLSNVLLDEVSLEQACRPTGQENLSILSAGRHLETGTELLGSPRFRELMQTLRERYDRIVVDTPPVLGLSETSIMQSLVDGVMFVIWTGNTPARSAKAAVDMLAANGANFYGFVLNRLDLSATANYYQYYYYSHDYYYQHPLENA
jgi:capsular exopolysaccharide synthesis family protein